MVRETNPGVREEGFGCKAPVLTLSQAQAAADLVYLH